MLIAAANPNAAHSWFLVMIILALVGLVFAFFEKAITMAILFGTLCVCGVGFFLMT